ncbi:ABC_tran domain-containing protein/ABC_membrane domain-containing protein [Cephalotus follicularis]|uniref:ABC_tran domain-containing protein/ABC_membrane domain-containing protein n=1 Tax=Cephalotus follicularis TaxID=3775 RepID=A0A1Q3B1S9_CEPFO|nr:ABC_tran domain-containing protein/ABC_membrane domain-containing protein [Cephalotus follicularis]
MKITASLLSHPLSYNIRHRQTNRNSPMASATTRPLLIQTNLTRSTSHNRHAHKLRGFSTSLRQSSSFPPISHRQLNTRTSPKIVAAYVSGPASDPIVSESYPKIKETVSRRDEEEEAVKSRKLISWRLLWSLLVKHKLRLGVSVLALVGCTTCTLSMPIYSGRFFEVLIGARAEPLWSLLGKVGVLYSLEPVFTVIFVVNINSIWEKVMSTLRAKIFRTVLIQKMEFFDRYKVGELSGLLTSDLGAVKNVISENISRDRGFRALSEVMGTICILFTLAPQLAPILGVLILTVSVFVAVYKRSTVPVFKAHGLAQALISDCVTETFSAIRTVRSFGGERHQMVMFGSQVLASQSSGIKLGTFKSVNESLTRIAVYVSLMALYCLGGSKVKAGELSVGTMASFIGYTFTLTFAVQGLVNTFGDLRGTLAAIERINSVLSGSETDEALANGLEKEMHRKEVKDINIELFLFDGFDGSNRSLNMHYMSPLKSTSNVCSLAWSGDVCLEDVHFSYPLRPDVKILNGLNLTLRCGTVTALVGSSGAGKSTIVQLLGRFYEPTRGHIRIAGEDVRTFDKSEWARAVSIVNQEPVLFSVSVGENIAYGLPDDNVSKDDVIKAAKAANAHEFIISLPQGYDTLVGERGGLLSGGQRQRIAIARALLKNSPILILDEATSALDAVSEKLVQDALSHLVKGRTTLVIAHRLSTVQNAHRIAVCSDGRIAELGTHLELLARKGQYASLVATQRLAFE